MLIKTKSIIGGAQSPAFLIGFHRLSINLIGGSDGDE